MIVCTYFASRSFTISGSTKKRHRHLHPFAGLQHLFFKAEALDLVEIAARRIRRHVVAGRPGNRTVGRVVGLVEGQTGFADAHFHLALDRFELPGHVAVQRGVKADLDGLVQDIVRGGLGTRRSRRQSRSPGRTSRKTAPTPRPAPPMTTTTATVCSNGLSQDRTCAISSGPRRCMRHFERRRW